MPPKDEFTPFLPTLREPVTAALHRLFALGSKVDITWQKIADIPSGKIGGLRVTLSSPKRPQLILDLSDKDPTRPSWLNGTYMALAYRKTPEGKEPISVPVLKPLLVHAAKSFRSREEQVFPELSQALVELRRFDGVEDWMFRQRTEQPGAVVGNLRLGFGCNQDCSFCWQDRGWPEPPSELYFTWLDELAALGVDTLIITGGEPTVHKALPELVKRAAQTHKMRVQLQSNAIQFRRPKLLKSLLDSGLESAFISFHSADAAVSDHMTRARGTYKNTVKGISAALDAGLHIDLNCVVETQNVHTLGEHARFIVEHFVKPFPDNPIGRVTYSHPASYYDRDAWAAAMVPLDEVRPQLLSAALTLTDAGIPVEVIGTCGFPPCLFSGHDELVRSLPRDEVSSWDQRSRAYAPECEDCAGKRHCLGLRKAYLERFGSRGIMPFTTDPDPPRRPVLDVLAQHAEPSLP